MTVKAIYENGVFRPTEPVHIAERTAVEVIVPETDARDVGKQIETAAIVHASAIPANGAPTEPMRKIYAILSRSYETGRADLAERHNEHQP